MNRNLHRIGSLFASGVLVTCLGCGSSTEVSEVAESATPASDRGAERRPEEAAMEVVSRFLDRVRRGGDDGAAGNLLTEKARSELERIGRTVQPIGSPDARFEVSRGELVPDQPGAALVHSVWSEPNGDGSRAEYQVVWAVEQDPKRWRISGLAMEFEPGQPPEIIDFEDGELMARLLTASEQQAGEPVTQDDSAAGPAESQAAAGQPTRTR